MLLRRPKVIAAPDTEPLTLAQVRQHCNVTPYEIDSDGNGTHPDDDLLLALLTAAREHCEDYLGLSLATCVLEVALDAFPTVAADGSTAIELPWGPVREVLSVTYGAAGSDGVVSSNGSGAGIVEDTEFTLDLHSTPARIVPITSWPSIAASTNNIRVNYLAGYGEDTDGGEPCPRLLLAAMKLVLGHLYANREDGIAGAFDTLPLNAEALMRSRRVRLGMA
jgi:uncharacterized phiE125 gp8 family phage protein